VVCDMPTADIGHFVLATDGAGEYLTRPESTTPRTSIDRANARADQPVLEDDRYYRNPAALGRQLTWRPATGRAAAVCSADDTTVIAGRRLQTPAAVPDIILLT